MEICNPLFEWFSKLLGVSAGFIYLVGFLVVTHHLSSYGASSLSLFQIQYLVAGIWAIAPIALIALTQRASTRFSERALSDKKVSWRRRTAVGFMAPLPVTLLMAAAILFASNAGRGGWTEGVLAFVLYSLTANTGDLLWMSWKATETRETWFVNRKAVPYYATLFMAIFLLYVLFFAKRVYPLIPYSIGGGKPVTVVFIADDRDAPAFLAVDKATHTSTPFRLLATTDKTFIVLPTKPDQQSIEFKRDAVQGVIVLKDAGP